MKLEQDLLKKILLDGSYVTEDDIKNAERYQEEHRSSILEYLLVEGITSTDIVGQAIAEYLGSSYSNIIAHPPAKEHVLLIPENIARKYKVVVFNIEGNKVVVATDEPKNESLKEELSKIFKDKEIVITFSMPDDIESTFVNYEQSLETQFSKITKTKTRIAPEIVDQIIEDALSLKASDIHCEPREKEVMIRFRIDGVLHDAGKIPKEYYENVVNRVKVQSKLRIDEHFSPQDGAIRFTSKVYDVPVDLRVSIIPTLDGEKIAIRVLSSYVKDLTLTDIGLSQELYEQVLKSSKKPFGMILVTGPTGSGKSTTLYSIIKIVNTKDRNITTIEDPVEYKIVGVNQIQANTQTNLTFAKGLRSIMRQDPNVILVGEIRDLETADIAVNASLTGHLLLSTFHSNDAVTAIPRFIDMGIEPFLIGSTLELIIAQRLVRRICDSCKVSYDITNQELNNLGVEADKYFEGEKISLYKGKGCEACSNTGFKGRIGVFEFVTMTPALQDLISKSPSTKEINDLIRQQGFKTMFEDGIDKVKTGITTIEEVVRVINS